MLSFCCSPLFDCSWLIRPSVRYSGATSTNFGEENYTPRSCGDSNSQRFDHESGVLPTSYPGSLFVLTLIRCMFHPVLLQWHVKDPDHSAKSASGRLHLNTLTPLTQPTRRRLTVGLEQMTSTGTGGGVGSNRHWDYKGKNNSDTRGNTTHSGKIGKVTQTVGLWNITQELGLQGKVTKRDRERWGEQ